MEDKKVKVYITLVQIYAPRGGDFYIPISSSKIKSSDDLSHLNLNSYDSKDQVMKKIHTVDPNAKVVGGIIMAKNQDLEIGGVFKLNDGNDVAVNDILKSLEEKIEKFKDDLKKDLIKKGGR